MKKVLLFALFAVSAFGQIINPSGGGSGSGSSAGTTNDIQIAGAGNTFVADTGNFRELPGTHQVFINSASAAGTTGLIVQVGGGAVTYPGAVSSSGTFTADSQYRFFAQEDTWTPSVDGHGAAGFEGGVNITGTHTVDHYAAFESNPHYQGTGLVSNHYGFHDGPTIQNGATVNIRQAFHCDPVTLSGTGAVNTNECIYAAADTAGSSSNWFIVSDKVAPSYMKGKLAVGGANNPCCDMDVNNDIRAAVYKTSTNCAAVGTSASPSVVSCSAAAAGHFSCATNATGATCTINTSAVTVNSEIFIQESDTANTGTLLSVTCNTSTTVNPATRVLASQGAGTFTINLGTITTNPACFSYHVVN